MRCRGARIARSMPGPSQSAPMPRPVLHPAPEEKERDRITVDPTWSEEKLLANYGYDSDALLREVYGPILENARELGHEPGTPRRLD